MLLGARHPAYQLASKKLQIIGDYGCVRKSPRMIYADAKQEIEAKRKTFICK